MINELKKSVVHLECSFQNSNNTSRELDVYQTQGSALFIKDGEKRYLLTALHVFYESETSTLAHNLAVVSRKSGKNVVLIDYPLRNIQKAVSVIENENEGMQEIDFAIISLDQRDYLSVIAYELIQKGYVPLDISDIVDGPEAEGEPIMAIGFPGTSRVGQFNQNNYSRIPLDISLPVTTFGRVAMLDDDHSSFLGDISVYPGNSGGPVFNEKSGKLIGIVSAQAAISVEHNSNQTELVTRIPMAYIVKTKFVKELISIQSEKEAADRISY